MSRPAGEALHELDRLTPALVPEQHDRVTAVLAEVPQQLVPIHSCGPSTTSQRTSRPGSSSATLMSNPPGSNRNSITPPRPVSPEVFSVHQPDRQPHGCHPPRNGWHPRAP